VNRILEPSEIQALEHSAIPRLRLPQRAQIFTARAQRLRALATENHLIRDYLLLMAELVDAQHDALGRLSRPLIAPLAATGKAGASLEQAGALQWSGRDPEWREVLEFLLTRLEAADVPTASLAAACARLRSLEPQALEREADLLYGSAAEDIDSTCAPLIAAALQVVWTDAASRLSPEQVPYPDAPGICPVCGTHAIASVVRVGGAQDGYRFLACGLCGTETHVVRVKCTHCDSTGGISYQMIEGQPDWAKAESCDECHTYRKIFYQSKELEAEPFADDLATLALDLLMNEAGYLRPAPHPFLWPAVGGDPHVH
jgi:FdhE protein